MFGNTARFRFCNTACIRQNQQQPRTRRYLCDGDEPCPHCHPSSLSLPTSYCSQHTHNAHPARTQYCGGRKHDSSFCSSHKLWIAVFTTSNCCQLQAALLRVSDILSFLKSPQKSHHCHQTLKVL